MVRWTRIPFDVAKYCVVFFSRFNRCNWFLRLGYGFLLLIYQMEGNTCNFSPKNPIHYTYSCIDNRYRNQNQNQGNADTVAVAADDDAGAGYIRGF